MIKSIYSKYVKVNSTDKGTKFRALFKRESGENPGRSRRCNGEKLHVCATDLVLGRLK